MGVATYSPKNMVILVGTEQITGFGDGDMVTVELDEDKFAPYVSVDGEVSRSHNVANTGKFTFTLNQTSKANALFTALMQLDLADRSGTSNGIVPIVVRDENSFNSGTFYIGTNCWITGMPSSAFGKEITTREWVLQASEIVWSISGNED